VAMSLYPDKQDLKYKVSNYAVYNVDDF